MSRDEDPRISFLTRLLTSSEQMPAWVMSFLLVTTTALVGWADYITGWRWSLFVFYAVPISLASWWGGRSVGFYMALVCWAVWGFEYFQNQEHENKIEYLLLGVSRLAYFSLAAVGGATIRYRQETDATRIRALEELRQMEQDIVAVSEHEQQRIGQDLHDGICQQLAAITCAARALADDLRAKELPEADDAEQIEAELSETVGEARSLARGIFPVHVDRTGLSAALRNLAENTTRMTGIPVELADWSEVQVQDPDVAMHLYRIAQEALSNAVKHSGASAITITLRPMGDTLELRVDDNGRGFSSKAHGKVSGMGQRTMRYRARALGAYLEIEPGPEGGTSVCCHLRVRARREH